MCAPGGRDGEFLGRLSAGVSGALQGSDMPLDLIGYITQGQFRNLLAVSKVLGPQLAADAADDAFLQAMQAFKVVMAPLPSWSGHLWSLSAHNLHR